MTLVAHHAVAIDLPARFLGSPGQGLNEIQAVRVVQQNVIAPVPTTHQMAHGTRKVNAQLARHGPIVAVPPTLFVKNAQCKGLAPFREPAPPPRNFQPLGRGSGPGTRQRRPCCPKTIKNRQNVPLDPRVLFWQHPTVLSETRNQFSLTRAALGTRGAQKSKFLSILSVSAMSNPTSAPGATSQPPTTQSAGAAKSDFLAAEEIKGVLTGRVKGEQEKILRWVAESLGLAVATTPVAAPGQQSVALPSTLLHTVHETAATSVSARAKDIKAFVEEKEPRSDMQFAAVVAYYHRFESSEANRKEAITSRDLQDAARLAGRLRFRTPSATLNNAVRQGYFDRADRGEFKLNAVGENLVAMALPASGEDAPRNGASRAGGRRQGSRAKRTKGGKGAKA